MSTNIGEEIVGMYLTNVYNCNFVNYNIYTTKIQGEIDVIGIDLEKRDIYICEVAIHLGGLLYVGKDKRSDNYNKLIEKFKRGKDYADEYFNHYTKKYMFWSPIVKNTPSQLDAVSKATQTLKTKYAIELELIINKNYQNCIDELRTYAKSQTTDLKSSILRFIQIEYALDKHLKNLKI